MTEQTKPSIWQRVHQILAELPPIGKNSRAPQAMGGYAFRGIEDILAVLQPLLAKHGVFFVPETAAREDSVRQTAQGKALYVCDVQVRFRFYDHEGDSFCATVWGQGSDSGDKAVSKAYTSALKTMLSPTFCISDGQTDTEAHDVPDSQPTDTEAPDSQPTPASKERVEHVRTLATEAGIEQWVKDQGFPWPWPPSVCDQIETKATAVLGTLEEPF